MKKILILSAAVLLTACASLQFDALEYDRYITVQEIAQQAQSNCSDTYTIQGQVDELKIAMDHQFSYAQYREAKPQVAEAAKSLKEMIDALHKRYHSDIPTVGYCEEKLKNITLGAQTVARTLGRM